MSQTILITGGTGKFGRKFVEHFFRKGWVVLFTSTSESRVDNLKYSLGNHHKVQGFVFDLTQPEAPMSLVKSIVAEGFKINHVVNNARSLTSLVTNDRGETERTAFMEEYLMDVVVPYELSMACYTSFTKELSTITNIGSQYGLVAANRHLYNDYPKQSPIQYGVAKAALNHLTKELAVRFASEGIRVNCIAYGGVEGRADLDFKKRYSLMVPTGRMLEESEITGPLNFLIDDACSAITGQTVTADGGWTLW